VGGCCRTGISNQQAGAKKGFCFQACPPREVIATAGASIELPCASRNQSTAARRYRGCGIRPAYRQLWHLQVPSATGILAVRRETLADAVMSLHQLGRRRRSARRARTLAGQAWAIFHSNVVIARCLGQGAEEGVAARASDLQGGALAQRRLRARMWQAQAGAVGPSQVAELLAGASGPACQRASPSARPVLGL